METKLGENVEGATEKEGMKTKLVGKDVEGVGE